MMHRCGGGHNKRAPAWKHGDVFRVDVYLLETIPKSAGISFQDASETV
jgi:hypothetical protein